MAAYVNLLRGRPSSDKSTSFAQFDPTFEFRASLWAVGDVDRTESTPSPDIDAIELAPVVKKPEHVELKEIKKGEMEERVFHELTRQTSSHHSVVSIPTASHDDDVLSDEVDFSDPEVHVSETSSTDTDEGYDHVKNPLPSFTEILYSKEQVTVFTEKSAKLTGRLSVIKQHGIVFVTWTPKPVKVVSNTYSIPPIPLSEVRAITRYTPALGWHYIILILRSGCSFPPLYFNNAPQKRVRRIGGVRSLVATLKEHANIVKAIDDPNTYLINESPDPLRRSLHSMDLEDLVLSGVGEESYSFDQDLLSGAISKLRQLAIDTTTHLFGYEEAEEEETSPSPCTPPDEGTARLPADGTSVNTEVGSFEVLDMLGSRPTDRFQSLKHQGAWGKEMTAMEFRSYFSSDGVMKDVDRFRERVFYGGFNPVVRKEGWKYLFGLWNVEWTRVKCEEVSREKEQQYQAILGQWQSITPDQAKRFGKWRDRMSKVDKDVRRTDRTEHFFRHEHGNALAALRRILLSYVMYNFDLGYCQGMSDLASPILYVISLGVNPKNAAQWRRVEAEAFWCFSGMMDRVEGNFHTDQRSMHSQLTGLKKLLQLLDPQLYAHFKQMDCLNFFFCFRWVLILFKREFLFQEVMRLWEAFFSGHRTPYFHLYFCVAVLVTHRNIILQGNMDFDELLKFSCDLAYKIDLMPTLKLATVLSAWAEPIEADCLADIPDMTV